MISVAQFRQWIRDRSSRIVVLAELQFCYQSASLPVEGTIYLADYPYITRPTDTPANTRYRDVLITSPDSERAINLTTLGGRGTTSIGSLTLNNADGSLDFLLDAIADGRDIKFYVGDKAWARADFRLMLTAVVASSRGDNDSQITLTLKDRTFLLDVAIVGSTIATGPSAGKSKPVAMGYVHNMDITPYLFDIATLKYYVNDFGLKAGSFSNALSGLVVRDSGASLESGGFGFTGLSVNAATDTIDFGMTTGLAADDVIYIPQPGTGFFSDTNLAFNTQYWVIASGLTSSACKVSLTKGGAAVDLTGTTLNGTGGTVFALVRRRFYLDEGNAILQLSSSPAGRATLDLVFNDFADTLGDNAAPHAAFKYILDHYTRLAATDYDAAAIAALAAAELFILRWGNAVLDRANVLDVLDLIALSTYSWYAPDYAGKLTAGRLDLANLDTAAPVATITDDDIEGELEVENLPLPWGRMVVLANRNFAVQTDGLVSSVTASNRALWAQGYQVQVTSTDPAGTDYPNDWWNYHKSATNSKPVETALCGSPGGDLSGVQTACDAMTELFRPWTRVYRCTVGLDAYFLADGTCLGPGACISLVYPRYKLAAGKNVRVMSVKPHLVDRTLELILVRRELPDSTTAAYA